MATARRVLSIREVADYLRISVTTIYRLLKKGLLPAFKLGSDWRFNVEDIDRWRLEQGAARSRKHGGEKAPP